MSQPSAGAPASPPDDPTPSPTPAAAAHNPAASLPELFWIFFQIGAFSFGGGLSVWVHREIVTKRGWLTETEFLTGLALCQVLPGVNVVNLAVHVGQRLRGAIGAVVCTTAIVFVPFFVVIGLINVYDLIKEIAWLADFLDGVAVAAVGLMVSMAFRSVKGTFKGVMPFVIALTLIVTVGFLRWPMIPIALSMAILSVAFVWLSHRRRTGGR